MLTELQAYHRPENLQAALELLREPGALALAGGTELLGRSDSVTSSVIDLQSVGLDYIRSGDAGVQIGAMTRLQNFIDHPLLKPLGDGVLHAAAMQLASTERQAATLGGSLAVARPDSELNAALLVLDAEVVIQDAATRRQLALAELLGSAESTLAHGTLITELLIPPQPAARYGLQRVSRTPADHAILCVAARLSAREGRLCDVRLSAGGVAAHALRLSAAERLLEGTALDAVPVAAAARAGQEASAPSGDHRASAQYRHAMLGVLLTRIVNDLLASLRTDHP